MSPSRRPRGETIDWERIKARLAAAEQALAAELEVSPQKRRAVLHARALLHAAAPPRPETGGERIEVVEFLLGAQRHAIEAAWVHEVLPLDALTPLPCTPDFVAGIVHLHGRIVTAIDLKRVFGLPVTGITDLNRLVVVRHGGSELGLLADRIVGVSWLLLTDLHAAPADDLRAGGLRGIAAGELALLDIDRLMNDPKMVVDDTAGI
jgi:purine-binding chemotaxis protein CheW